MDIVAGTLKPSDADAHATMIQELNRVFDAQKLISLKTLLDIADQTDSCGQGREDERGAASTG